ACGKRGAIERHARPPAMLSARSLRKASIPPSLLSDPSPGCLQPTRLAVHVNGDGGSCSAYFASGCRVYKLEVSPSLPSPGTVARNHTVQWCLCSIAIRSLISGLDRVN
uniref:Uncharacterized protein n=1 Tax=Aegilops tauschii subsp. strangulata TaxID=200361 RepID=A0A453G0B5_AEGTS